MMMVMVMMNEGDANDNFYVDADVESMFSYLDGMQMMYLMQIISNHDTNAIDAIFLYMSAMLVMLTMPIMLVFSALLLLPLSGNIRHPFLGVIIHYPPQTYHHHLPASSH